MFILTGEAAALFVVRFPDHTDSGLYYLLVVIALFLQFGLFAILTVPKPPAADQDAPARKRDQKR